MVPFVVPQLLGKLNLLIDYGPFKNMAEIAAEFEITEDAVRFWTKETDGQEAGTVPPKRVEKLLALFARQLPDMSLEQVEGLLLGSIADLEDALRLGEYKSLRLILSRRADVKSGKLIPVNTTGMGLVVANRLSGKAHCKFPLGESFRLEFTTTHRGRYLLGLQKSPQAWGCVEVDLSQDRTTIHLPGKTDAGGFGSLDESSDEGVSEFYAFQSRKPFPAAFVKALMDEVPLGRGEISLLAQHLDGDADEEIHIMRFDVEFERTVSPSK